MSVVWLNGTVGSGKSAIGAALANLLPASRFLDGDDLAGPSYLPSAARWGMTLDALLTAVAGPGASSMACPCLPFGRNRLSTGAGCQRKSSQAFGRREPGRSDVHDTSGARREDADYG